MEENDCVTKKQFTWGKGETVDMKPMAEKLAQLEFMPLPEGDAPLGGESLERRKMAFELILSVIEDYIEENKEEIMKRAQARLDTIKMLR